ncbi:NADH dehydrogenase [ubiquinone] 1 beta subcomplex subunit 2, mitochondrial [Pogona vitticeps]|uniref:NADH dehydrogenase [ubiquinone] 1 beta subcomplex subunit 2, mitochondrial n=1 Tax=Pogona vitticeps TaxID=103695 RepID=A0A6J0U847_9SAUR|nr:NADH dehydrogenase [ubiquinone] 1 beta subcomplex subunit 2, mitochondrial [Pogona vitticeps]
MIGPLCRGAGGLRLVAGLLRARSGTGVVSGVRRSSEHGEFSYRQAPKITRYQIIVSESVSGFMWFWILWHCWHDYDEVLGHFPYPDVTQWTDEELGIPSDDE